MSESPPRQAPRSSAGHPRQALQPRDLAEEWDEGLWRTRLARAREAAVRARPRYEGAGPLRDRLREPGLWMLVGLPASGKSTFATALAERGRAVVGIDAVRAEGGLEFGTPAWQEDAYRRALERVEAALREGVAFESTGLWAPARERCRALAREHGLPVRALVIATDPEVCRPREVARRPEEPFFVRVVDVYAEVLEALPGEGYASVHWLEAADRERLLAAWPATPAPPPSRSPSPPRRRR